MSDQTPSIITDQGRSQCKAKLAGVVPFSALPSERRQGCRGERESLEFEVCIHLQSHTARGYRDCRSGARTVLGRHTRSAVRFRRKALVSGSDKGATRRPSPIRLKLRGPIGWQNAIANQDSQLLEAVHERLTMPCPSPQRYVRHSVFQELKRDAESVRSDEILEPRWPDSLSGAPVNSRC